MCPSHVATNPTHNEVKSVQNARKTTKIIIYNILFQGSVRFLSSISKTPGLKLNKITKYSKFCDFPQSLHFYPFLPDSFFNSHPIISHHTPTPTGSAII
jgi:hypothetical protein